MMKYTLEDTATLMSSANYKDRIVGEYLQLLIRVLKLERFLKKWDSGESNAIMAMYSWAPRGLYDVQLSTMRSYLEILELRAEYEKIDLSQYEVEI